MRYFKLNKLVRDGIIEKIRQQHPNNRVDFKKLFGAKKIEALLDKFQEESAEMKKTKDTVSELIDMQSLIHATVKKLGLNQEGFELMVQEKDKKAGGFDEGFYIREVGLDENDEWLEYYLENFKEIKK